MRLSKNKISKILNGNKQSRKKIIDGHANKNNRKKRGSFRKIKPLNLRAKTLKHFIGHKKNKKIYIGGNYKSIIIAKLNTYEANQNGDNKKKFVSSLLSYYKNKYDVEIPDNDHLEQKYEANKPNDLMCYPDDLKQYTGSDAGLRDFMKHYKKYLSTYGNLTPNKPNDTQVRERDNFNIYYHLKENTNFLFEECNENHYSTYAINYLYMSRSTLTNPEDGVSYETELTRIKPKIDKFSIDKGVKILARKISIELGIEDIFSIADNEISSWEARNIKDKAHVNLEKFHCYINNCSKKFYSINKTTSPFKLFPKVSEMKEKLIEISVSAAQIISIKKIIEGPPEQQLGVDKFPKLEGFYTKMMKDELKNIIHNGILHKTKALSDAITKVSDISISSKNSIISIINEEESKKNIIYQVYLQTQNIFQNIYMIRF